MKIITQAEIMFFHLGKTQFNVYYHMAKTAMPADYSPYKFIPFKHYLDNIPPEVTKLWFDIVYYCNRHKKVASLWVVENFTNEPTKQQIIDCANKLHFHQDKLGYVKAVRYMTGMGLADCVAYVNRNFDF